MTSYKILVIEDDKTYQNMIEDILTPQYETIFTESVKEALAILKRISVDLILLDLTLPEMNGFDFLRCISRKPLIKNIPVIILSDSSTEADEEKGLTLGAVDYIKKPYNPNIIKIKVSNHIELKSYRDDLQKIIAERTKEVDHLYEAVLASIATLVDSRDEVTGCHISRIQKLAGLVANKIFIMHPDLISMETVEDIKRYAALHDIGKMTISDDILKKTGPLTPEEFEIMKTHTTKGAELLHAIIGTLGSEKRTGISIAIDIVRSHHERFDGTGYPDALCGKNIPFTAHIVGLADIYDALRSNRPYKRGFSHEESYDIIVNGDGRTRPEHFDPIILEAFQEIHLDIKRMYEEFDEQEL